VGFGEVVGYLLDNATKHNIFLDEPDTTGDTAILLAVKKGNAKQVSSLLDHGADSSICDLTGKTPTMLSARDGKSRILSILLANSASVFPKDLHKPDALYWACLSGVSDVVKQIVAKMQGTSEWQACCSAALHHIFTAEEPEELLNILLGNDDDKARAEIVTASEPDRNGWTLGYAIEHSELRSLLELPLWFRSTIKRSQGEP
jgi:ankyrin repeat protein